ncbi:MAG: hypothetical protein HY923_03355 [Elusimicrobia bacterium]|nr:hypothetical protein [Elusimicrobiota bacterium]
MKRLLLLALMAWVVPAIAYAGPCPSSDGSPCLPDDGTQKDLLRRIREVQALNNEIRSAAIVWQNSRAGTDRAGELSKYEAYAQAKNTFDDKSVKLIDQIQKAYNVAPTHTSGLTRKPSGTNRTMAWMDGLPAQWKPRFSNNDDDYRAIQTKSGTHYASVNTAAYAGATLPNGDVVIGASLLSEALKDQNPGIIAQAIYHEGRHFADLVTTGWRSIEQGEVAAYTAVAAHDDTFKLSEGWLQLNAANLLANQAALDAGSERAYAITAKDEKLIKGIIDQEKARQGDFAKYYAILKAEVTKTTAEREHDELLKKTIASIALRSCANPGSVTQDELNALDKPYRKDFYRGEFPKGLEGADGTGYCTEPYFYLGDMAGANPDALRLKSLSTPRQPAISPPLPEQHVPAVPVDLAALTISNMRRLAILACDYPGRLTYADTTGAIKTAYVPLPAAQSAGSDLTGCARFVYDALVFFVPQGYRGALTPDWLRERALAYSPPTPPRGEPGGGRGSPPRKDPCYWDPGCNCRVCED